MQSVLYISHFLGQKCIYSRSAIHGSSWPENCLSLICWKLFGGREILPGTRRPIHGLAHSDSSLARRRITHESRTSHLCFPHEPHVHRPPLASSNHRGSARCHSLARINEVRQLSFRKSLLLSPGFHL